MEKKFDIRKIKYLKGAIESGMSDDKIIEWLEKSNYSTNDFLQIIKMLVEDFNSKKD